MIAKRGITLHLGKRIAFNAIVLDSENCQFSDTQRGQCTERPQSCHTFFFRCGLLGGLSVSVCCVGMAVPLNRTGCKSPPLFFGGGNNLGNIAHNQLILLLMKKVEKFLTLLILFIGASLFSACSDDKDEPQNIHVEFPENNVVMLIGEHRSIRPIIEGASIPLNEFEWKNSNPDIAEVVLGMVYAKKVGKITITLTYRDKIMSYCHIEVLPIRATELTLSHTNIELELGESFCLKATISPDNTTNKTIIWSALDETIAKVDDKGIITAQSLGETIIRATVEGSEIEAQCKVKVNPILLEEILGLHDYSILIGQSYLFSVELSPENATNRELRWTSSNPEIVSVSEKGVITGLSFGESILTAYAMDDSGCSASCKIQVCGIDAFITLNTMVGSQGSSSSGYYSYLDLLFRTNTEDPVLVTSVLVIDDNNTLKAIEYPNKLCTEYSLKVITKYHGNILSNTYQAIGWSVIVNYMWHDQEYSVRKLIKK